MPELRNLPLHLIDAPELPMRDVMDEEKLTSLMNSIVQIGQRYPGEVVERDGRYEIRTGHRRLVALQRLGRETMMVMVLKPEEDAGFAAMLAENAEREEVNRAAEAVWMAQLVEKKGCTEEDLCALVKRSPDYIGDNFRLLRNDEQVFNAVLSRQINFSVARELNKCTDPLMRRSFLDQAIRSGTSARVVSDWVRSWRVNTGGVPIPTPQPQEPGEAPPIVPNQIACVLCGGHLDPYNLVSVYIHKWELEHLQRQIQKAARDGES